jgi:hypothetical protein
MYTRFEVTSEDYEKYFAAMTQKMEKEEKPAKKSR